MSWLARQQLLVHVHTSRCCCGGSRTGRAGATGTTATALSFLLSRQAPSSEQVGGGEENEEFDGT